jgi:hypothetical protein
MARALLPKATLHLHYSVTVADDAAFLPEFDAIRQAHRGFGFTLRRTAKRGRIPEGKIRRFVQRYPGAKFHVCGPPGYVQYIRGALKAARVAPSRIHVELFALTPASALARTFRFKAYAAGAMLAALPLFALLPALDEVRPHGHPNVGHEQLKCVSCHVETGASMRQTLQAKARHALGLRRTGAVMGTQPVTSATCIQCHANPDDRHAPNRFFEPRFERARADLGPQLCVSCHREHSAARVTVPTAGYCVNCHQDLKVKDDKASPTHDYLVQNKRWETCLQCHDYHGNHRWNAPLRLQDATALEVLNKYLLNGPSPYGATVVKSKPGSPS